MENTPQTPMRRERRACRTAEPGDPGGDACPCPVLCVQEPGDRAGATLERPEKGGKDPTVFQQDPFVENRAQGKRVPLEAVVITQREVVTMKQVRAVEGAGHRPGIGRRLRCGS